MGIYCRSVLVIALCCVLASAQITFSRDWSGGKRAAPAAPAPQIALDCGQFARLCRHFIHELKSSMGDAASGKRRRSDLQDSSMYEDE